MVSISGFATYGNEMSLALRSVLSANPESVEYSPMMASALGYARTGFSLIPCKEGTKEPRTTKVFRNGGKSATRNYDRVLDHWEKYPYDNVGLGSDGTMVYVDIDSRHGGSLEKLESLGLPIDGHRFRTVSNGSWRVPFRMPDGMLAVNSPELVPGVEIKAKGKYALAPHSRAASKDTGELGWYRIEPGREVWHIPQISEHWQYLDRLTQSTATTSAEIVTQSDMDAAGLLIARMREDSTYRDTLSLILAGDWEEAGYPCRSKADFALALAGSHFLRHDDRAPEILTVILDRHSLKAPSRRNPDAYIHGVVTNVLNVRHDKDTDRLAQFFNTFVSPYLPLPTTDAETPTAKNVLAAKFVKRGVRGVVLDDAILGFAGSDVVDEFTRENRWRRFPVQDVADIFDVSRESIRQKLVSLVDRDLIERDPRNLPHDGGPRCDSRIRLVEA